MAALPSTFGRPRETFKPDARRIVDETWPDSVGANPGLPVGGDRQ